MLASLFSSGRTQGHWTTASDSFMRVGYPLHAEVSPNVRRNDCGRPGDHAESARALGTLSPGRTTRVAALSFLATDPVVKFTLWCPAGPTCHMAAKIHGSDSD